MTNNADFFLLPQVVQQDSSKKSSDILPFAPFLKPGQQQQKAEQQKALQKKAQPPVVNRQEKKEEKTAAPVTRTDSLKTTASQKADAVKKITKAEMEAAHNDSVRLQDSAQATMQATATADSLQMIQNTVSTFRFDDNDSDSYSSASTEVPALNASRILTAHLLPPSGSNPKPVYRGIPDWFTIILFIIIAAFTTIKVFYNRVFNQLFKSFISTSVTSQVVRDENILVQRATIMLSVIFYLIGALFLYQLSVRFGWQADWMSEGFSRFLVFALLLSAMYSFKMLFLKLVSIVFNIDRPVATYIFTIFLLNNVTGMVLIPLVAAIAYMSVGFTDYIFRFSVLFVGIAFLYRLVRGFGIALTIPRFSIFYLILYFCTLEIAPLMVIFKLAKG